MPFKNILQKLKDAGEVVSQPAEYDELDTSGYLPNQQMAGQGMLKSLGVIGALSPDPTEVETPSGMKIAIDPTMIGGLKDIGKLAKLANIKSPLIPNEQIRKLASEYSESKGLSSDILPPIKPDDLRGKLIADAYQKMKHNPNDPEVKAAYDALIKETKDQYNKILETGFEPIKMTPGMENPYRAGSKDLLRDIKQNNKMYYYPTEQGFGSENIITDNPMLQKSGVMIGGEEVPNNDLFRIVHDYFGHGTEGHGFGPMGEENAWIKHSQMYSPEARRALTTETRGQNSWVNYGPYGEANRANPAQTIYADQKVGLLPDWVTDLPVTKEDNSELIRRLMGVEQSGIKNFPNLNQSLKKEE